MSIHHTCHHCGSKIKGPDQYAGRRIRCPRCDVAQVLPATVTEVEEVEVVMAEVVTKEEETTEESPWEVKFLDNLHEPMPVTEFVEPPNDKPPVGTPGKESQTQEPKTPWMRKMFEAMLDPRSIQWLLTLGGGIMVLGGLIWLISWGLFENAFALAVVMGSGSVALLVCGWFTVLKTRYRIAGRAISFLGCIVLPLNLWFYDAQGLLLLEHGLWMAGVVCVLFYVATVWLLRDPLFMYAVEGGLTLTGVLLLGDFGVAGNATELSILLMAMALISIHAHKAFAADDTEFSQKKFGMPLFWCGHIQLLASLIVLSATQLAGTLALVGTFFDLPADGVLLTATRWAPGILWLLAAYAYVYSDLVVRRVGLYLYLAAGSLIMAQITLIGFDLMGIEGMIASLAITATAIGLLSTRIPKTDTPIARTVPPLALLFSIVPVVMGLWLHVRATTVIFDGTPLDYESTWLFVGVMLLVAIANRVSAVVYREKSAGLAGAYLFFTAGAILVAAAGTLRMVGIDAWLYQVPWLMLIPIGYLIASRLWRGHWPERPLVAVAQSATGVILLSSAGSAIVAVTDGLTTEMHFQFSLILALTSAFYGLAAFLRPKSVNLFAAVAAACGAVWQIMLYMQWEPSLFSTVFAIIGFALLVVARSLGLNQEDVYDASGRGRKVLRGPGLHFLGAGHAVLAISIVTAIMKGISRLFAAGLKDGEIMAYDWISLALVTAAAIGAAITSPRKDERRLYTVLSVATAALCFLTLNIAIDLSLVRKLEIFIVGIGIIMLGGSYIGRFREEGQSDGVSIGLWLGSLFTSIPLLVTVFYHWGTINEFALYDELVLVTITLLMLVTGILWQVKASTLFGGGTLAIYLVVLVVSVIHTPQIAVGIYLTAGGGIVFLIGILLAIYRERLLALPERIANRKGIFQVISWR